MTSVSTNACSAWINVITTTGIFASSVKPNDNTTLQLCIDYLMTLFNILNNNPNENNEYDDQPPSFLPPPLPSQLVLHHNNNHNNTPLLSEEEATTMTSRRIVIRILTTLSEIYAIQGMNLGKMKQWVDGVNAYSNSYKFVNYALQIADEKYATLFHLHEQQQQQHDRDEHNIIANDCNIIHITLSHFASQRDKYTIIAQRRKHYLETILIPQWEARDEIRDKLGEYWWRNNPNPKHVQSDMRKKDEQELKDIDNAVETLEGLETRKIELRIQNVMTGGDGSNGDSGYDDSLPLLSELEQSGMENGMRYNGIRPNYNYGQSNRVAFEQYPDPTEYGWMFTGSCEESFVEFFEKSIDNDNDNGFSIVKLDFYYTTASIKTSLHHPIQGKTQMFGRKGSVTPELYLEILLNPRVHTGVRYQKRRRNKRSNNSRRSRNGGTRRVVNGASS